MTKQNSIAIFGGTFDPIHNGHLIAAWRVFEELNLDKILFMPTGKTPHKKNENITSKELRTQMIKLAIKNNNNFAFSDFELKNDEINYTADTLVNLTKIWLDTHIYFIMGADSLLDIENWKNFVQIFDNCSIIVLNRDNLDLDKHIDLLTTKYKANIIPIKMENIAISSTDIRHRLNNGKSIKYLVPKAVEKYIYKNSIYKQLNPDCMLFLKNTLTKKKYIHSLGVANEALNLAIHYNLPDVNAAFFAGAFHDIAKCYTNDKLLELCKNYKLDIDPFMQTNLAITHGMVGAKIVEEIMPTATKDILNAISYHSTGRANMSMLEKIIYIADIIEPNRGNNPHLNNLRKIAYQDIDQAIKICLDYTLEKCAKKDTVFHPLGLLALEDLLKN